MEAETGGDLLERAFVDPVDSSDDVVLPSEFW